MKEQAPGLAEAPDTLTQRSRVSAVAAGLQKEAIGQRPQRQEESGRGRLRPKPGPPWASLSQSGCCKHLPGGGGDCEAQRGVQQEPWAGFWGA